jgi:glycosyltransferase involved in cell wall biosynthesis
MNILVLTHHDISTKSGGDLIRANRIAELLKDYWKVELKGFTGYSPEVPLLKMAQSSPSWIGSTVRKVLSKNFDWIYIVNDPYLVLLCHSLRKFGFGDYRLAYDVCLTRKIQKMKTIKTPIIEKLDRLTLLCSDLIVTTSKQGERLLNQYKDKVIIVPNFVNLKVFRKDNKKRSEIREKYGIAPEERVVGLIGPFNNKYNKPFLDFLRKRIDEFDERIRFLVIGKYRPQEFFKRRNIVWTGYVEDYIAHLSALDCLLIPRTIQTEGAMNKALEAMALGIPVFTTPIGYANLEHLKHGEHLFVFPEEELPRAINKLLFNDELMIEVGLRARLQIERFYSAEAVKRKLLQRLEQCRGK